MHYILQKTSIFDLDIAILKEILQQRKRLDTYEELTLQELTLATKDRINPIEVPKCLRTEEFLKRDYRVVPFNDIPHGTYFVKDASRLKHYTFFGDTEQLFTGREAGRVDRSHMFQVSEIEDILSEYRVYVIGGEIVNICNYDGSVLIFPDTTLVCKANGLYKTRSDYPKSLTIDVMITKKGTEIIEIHPFIACGLYSTLWGDNLLDAYRDGIEYVINHNTKISQ